MPTPAQRTIEAPSKKATGKAKSEADWLAKEKAERPGRRPSGDAINDAIGRDIHMAQASYPSWKSPSTKRRLTVTRFYFHPPAVIIDRPGTLDEMTDKAQFFKTTDISYVGIEPGTSMDPSDLTKLIDKAIKATKAAQKGRKARNKAIPKMLPKVLKAPKQTSKTTPPKTAKKAKGK